MVFLLGGWKDGIKVGKGVRKEAKSWETRIENFLSNVKALIAEEGEEEEEEKKGNRAKQPPGSPEHAIYEEYPPPLIINSL